MFLTHGERTPYWRTLLVLGRASNLPTVWSNCFAGWLLGGSGSFWIFLPLCLGATCLYTGGMFLNDAFDVEFDRTHRKERPVPSGAISLDEVWRWGFGWLGGGAVMLILLGKTTGLLAVMLIVCIVVYDALHKQTGFSPVLMAACRFFLYLLAASGAQDGVTGAAIWSGLALAAYIIGLSYLARQESTRGTLDYWPCCFLFAPILLAVVMNGRGFQFRAVLFSVVVGLWILRCVNQVFWSPQTNIGRAVAGLLAGIVLVDLLAVAGGTTWTSPGFLLLFAATLLFQRLVPAT